MPGNNRVSIFLWETMSLREYLSNFPIKVHHYLTVWGERIKFNYQKPH